MKTRILTVVTSVTLLCLTSGCGCLRQFWFGRGARCGPRCAPAPANVYPAPVYPPTAVAPPVIAAPSAGCGCEVAPPIVAEPVCGMESYGGLINDPYLSGEVVGDGVMIGNGAIIRDGAIVGEYPAGSSIPGTVLPDNFQPAETIRSNRFDTDGARIISEQPLPPGLVPAS